MLLLQRHAEEKIPREVVLEEYPTQRSSGSLDALKRSSGRTHLPEALSPPVAAASNESLMNKVPQAAPSQLHQPSWNFPRTGQSRPPATLQLHLQKILHIYKFIILF